MAYKKISSQGAPLTLNKENKTAEGYLLSVKKGSKRFPESRIYALQSSKGPVNVWGCATVNQCLLDGSGNLLPDYQNKMVRLTFQGMKKIRGRKQAMRDVQVEVDDSRKLTLKTYKSKN